MRSPAGGFIEGSAQHNLLSKIERLISTPNVQPATSGKQSGKKTPAQVISAVEREHQIMTRDPVPEELRPEAIDIEAEEAKDEPMAPIEEEPVQLESTEKPVEPE